MSEPFAKDAKRRARDSQTDTSFEKVWRYECGANKTMVLKYEGHWVKYSDYAALAAERDALQAKLAKAVGALHEIAGKKTYADDPWGVARATLTELKGQDDE